MTYRELIEQVAEISGLSKQEARDAMAAFRYVLADTLIAGDKVRLPRIGSFWAQEHQARPWVNPRTKEKTVLPAHREIAFSAAKVLRVAAH